MREFEQRIREQLDEIKDPCSLAAGQPMGLCEMGLIKAVEISPDGDVAISMRLTSPFCHMIGFFKTEIIERIGALSGVRSVTMAADQGLDWSPSDISRAAAARRNEALARMPT